MKREKDIWELINREKKRRRVVHEEIEEGVGREYFMKFLGGGVERKVIMGGAGERIRMGKEGEIEKEKWKRALGKLREGKVTEMDGIPGEVLKWGCGR